MQNINEKNIKYNYKNLIIRFFPYAKPYLLRILAGFFISIPAGAADGLLALSLMPYMDYVIKGKNFSFVFQDFSFSLTSSQTAVIIPLCVVLFSLVQGVLRYTNSYISYWGSTKITNSLKYELFSKLVNMDSTFFDRNSSGLLLTRFLGDPERACSGVINYIKSLITNLAAAGSLIAVMLCSSRKLALVGVCVLCAAFIPFLLLKKRIRETSNKNTLISGEIATNFNETYSGNKTVSGYLLQQRQLEKFNNALQNVYKNNISLVKRTSLMSPLMYLIASLGFASVLGFGTFLISAGEMTPGSFASFVTSLILLYKPIKCIGSTLTGGESTFAALKRVFELFDLEPKINTFDSKIHIHGLEDSIEFKNVNFGYRKDKLVLKNINLKINKGETIALVGASGEGKSTLANLIPRFYDVNTGEILFDGVNIKNISIQSLRKNIAIVFQDNFLFSGTIKENILIGTADASEDDFQSVLKSAFLDEMIQMLPDGCNTKLGERGINLSGGQRQRIAIARAMLKKAPVIILDEATSALDNKSEEIVQKALKNLVKDKTVIIVAHRFSSIKNADKIIVLNNNEIVETGTCEELMKTDGSLFQSQYAVDFDEKEMFVK